jgi:hypothetical protein
MIVLSSGYLFSAEFQPVAGLLIHSLPFRSTLRLLIRCEFYIRVGVVPMLRSILIVSRDQRLLDTRVLVLKSSGYSTVGTTSIDNALKLVKSVQPSVGIVCHTLPELEQSIFVNHTDSGDYRSRSSGQQGRDHLCCYGERLHTSVCQPSTTSGSWTVFSPARRCCLLPIAGTQARNIPTKPSGVSSTSLIRTAILTSTPPWATSPPTPPGTEATPRKRPMRSLRHWEAERLDRSADLQVASQRISARSGR